MASSQVPAVDLSPAQLRALSAQATAYYRKGDNVNAIKIWNEILQRQPTFVSAYIDRGTGYESMGQPDRALNDFNEAIRLDAKSARAYCDRAMLEDVELRQPDNALKDFDQAIRLAPNFWRAYYNRGGHFLLQHDYRRAIPDYTRAIQLTPNDLASYACRALAYAKEGDRQHALADAQVVTELKPTEIHIWQPVDLRVRATVYRMIDRPELALRDLREGVRVMPSDAHANNALAWFLATAPEERVRNGTEAVSVAMKACNLTHWQKWWCLDTLAAAHAEVGNFDQAVKFERQSLSESSLSPKQRAQLEKHLSVFEQRKPFRDDVFAKD